MRKAIVVALAIGGLGALPAEPAAAKKAVRFTDKLIGAQISATQAAFKLHDSYFGDGAGVQTAKLNAALTAGTDVTTTYYGNASATSKDAFTIGKPNAQGVATLTGSGHDVRGTGRAKGLTSTYTFTGTVNFKTFVYSVTLTGTYFF